MRESTSFLKLVYLSKSFKNQFLLTLTYQKASIQQSDDAYMLKSAFQVVLVGISDVLLEIDD